MIKQYIIVENKGSFGTSLAFALGNVTYERAKARLKTQQELKPEKHYELHCIEGRRAA